LAKYPGEAGQSWEQPGICGRHCRAGEAFAWRLLFTSCLV
jgi:hypothetical protein